MCGVFMLLLFLLLLLSLFWRAFCIFNFSSNRLKMFLGFSEIPYCNSCRESHEYEYQLKNTFTPPASTKLLEIQLGKQTKTILLSLGFSFFFCLWKMFAVVVPKPHTKRENYPIHTRHLFSLPFFHNSAHFPNSYSLSPFVAYKHIHEKK